MVIGLNLVHLTEANYSGDDVGVVKLAFPQPCSHSLEAIREHLLASDSIWIATKTAVAIRIPRASLIQSIAKAIIDRARIAVGVGVDIVAFAELPNT